MSGAGDAVGSLDGLVALVSGGTGALGSATCVALAASGARVAAVGRRPPEAPLPAGVEFFACDVTDEAAVEELVGAVAARFGGLQLVINNAGNAEDGLLLRTSFAQWEQMLRVNLSSAFLLSKAAMRHLLKARERGRLVSIGSVVSEMGSAGQSAYAAAKAGLVGLSRSLARELGPRGVTVNVVSPGFIDSPMTARISDQRREQVLSQVVLGRMGRPQEVAALVRFLCAPEAAYITGQVLRVNGGLYI